MHALCTLLAASMIFSAPTPFAEAAQSHAVRALMPTNMSSAELERLDAAVLNRSFFAAKTMDEEFLQEAKDLVAELIAGDTDQATTRLKLKELLDRSNYQAPSPDEEGTITDLRSDQRLNLILETNLQLAQGYGAWRQGQDPAILDQWPAQELYDGNPGLTRNRRDWPAIWEAAGGTTFEGRLIALKDDPIWTEISRFGNPYAPFDYGSYWVTGDVDRETAVRAGLIDRDTQVEPQSLGFDAGGEGGPA